MRVAFDIGGVLSKYPHTFLRLVNHLLERGVDIFVITDMHDREEILKMLSLNKFWGIDPENVYSADYNTHGEGCKAELLKELEIDLFFDDFIGYVSVPADDTIRCLVMPDATKPYYHNDWKGVPEEPEFGRRVYKKE